MDTITKYQAALPFYNAAKQAISKAHAVDEVLNIKAKQEPLTRAEIRKLKREHMRIINNVDEVLRQPHRLHPIIEDQSL